MMNLVTIFIQTNHKKWLNSQRVHAQWMQLDVEMRSIYDAEHICDTWLIHMCDILLIHICDTMNADIRLNTLW